MAFDPLLIFNEATHLLDCAAEAITGAPERRYVAIGTPVHDNCCSPPGGQLTATVTRIYASTEFPDELLEATPCGPAYTAADIDLEIIRCAPGPSNNGRPPTVEVLTAFAEQSHRDARGLWRGVVCCLNAGLHPEDPAQPIVEYVVRGMTPVDPSGGCGGWLMSVTVGLRSGCLDCP